MGLSVFAGCSLVTRNDEKYYSATVSTVTYSDGTSDNITKRELLTAFNSYGYNYIKNYSMTQQEAIDKTLESIVDNYLTRKAVKDYYARLGEKLLNGNETTYLWDETYEAIFSNLTKYLEDFEENDEEEDSSEEANKAIFVDYVSTVSLDGTTIKRKTPASTIRANDNLERTFDGVVYDFEYTKDGVKVFQELMYENFQKLLNSDNEQSNKAWKGAYSEYISVIKSNYSYMKKSSNKEWFLFEMNRVYEIVRNNYIVEKYEIVFNQQKHQDVDITSVQALDVLKSYANKIETDYTTYEMQSSSSYSTDMLDTSKTVNYYLNNSQYFYVAPIKISLSSDDVSKIDGFKALKENGSITPERYNTLVNQVFNTQNNLVSVRNEKTGEVENKISVDRLYQDIKNDITAAGSYTEDERLNREVEIAKAEAYRKYFYLYNDEDTYKNADFNAVFGVDANGDVLASDTYNNDAIKTAIKNLYNAGNAKVGDVSEIVKVDNGYYIFFFAGNINNLFNVTNGKVSYTKEDIKVLAETRTNIFSSKTLLDSLYSELESDNFYVFQNLDINNLRNSADVKLFDANIKDLY